MSNKTMYEKEKEIIDKIDIKEAIKMFQNLIFVENHKIAENHCRKLAIESLEKQTPQKPITETVNRGISVSGEYDIDFDYLCPNCKTVVGDYETNDFFYKFCPECGQALDLDENQKKAVEKRKRNDVTTLQVLELRQQGKTYGEIAKELNCGENTVWRRLSKINKKTDRSECDE